MCEKLTRYLNSMGKIDDPFIYIIYCDSEVVIDSGIIDNTDFHKGEFVV